MTVEIESLAVKYRPRTLGDLVGQDHITSRIRGMLKAGKFPSSILITGETGCGKTTTARILARYINCSNPDKKTKAPCGECINCKYEESHPDVSELNLADTRGIDDIRALISSARSMPSMGSNRIFILDETHQLTAAASNCLLKSLEEPPAKTLWILATTNPEKLLPTIVGRCHAFALKRIELDELVGRLYKIAKKEGTDFKKVDEGKEILTTVANFSDGKMRNAIQLLEAVLYAVRSGEDINKREVIKRFVSTPEAELEKMAAELLVSLLNAELKPSVRLIETCGNARGLNSRARWLVRTLIQDSVGIPTYSTYGKRLFAKLSKSKELSVKLPALLYIQYVLADIDAKFNSLNLEEGVILSSYLGKFIADFHTNRNKG